MLRSQLVEASLDYLLLSMALPHAPRVGARSCRQMFDRCQDALIFEERGRLGAEAAFQFLQALPQDLPIGIRSDGKTMLEVANGECTRAIFQPQLLRLKRLDKRFP